MIDKIKHSQDTHSNLQIVLYLLIFYFMQLILNHFDAAMCGDGANDCGALKAAHAGTLLFYLINSFCAH